MPRITDEELARLKAIPLAELCRDYGIDLKPQGKDLAGRCPLPGHQDDTPSFVVTPSKNLWHCFGACGAGGDTIALVMKKEGVSFRHACEKLRARLGGAPSAPTITTRLGTSHEALATPEEAQDDAALLGRVADFYHRTFCNEPAAMKYLQSRACFHAEAVNAFRLGYANRTLGYRVPPIETAAGRQFKARLQALGVLRKETGHEHLNGCVVFPIHDLAGQVVQLYGRRLNAVGKHDRHLYLAQPKRGIWNAGALLPGADWLLCEALIDGLTLWCHGWRGVTASYGVHSFTAEHLALVAERKPGRIVITYDADTAGNTSAAALTHELAGCGVAVWRASPPEGKDINDVARAADDPAAALRAVIDGAKKIAGPVVVPVAKPEGGESPQPLLRGVDAAASSHTDTGAPVSSLAAVAAKKEAAAASPGDALTVAKNDAEEIVLTIGERAYRVRGLAKNTGYEALKVSLRATSGGAWHLDTLDLAQAKQRAAFVAAAAEETGVKPELLKRDVGQVLFKLEELQEARLRAQVAPEPAVKMTEAEEKAALALLRAPDLIGRIVADLAACGLVGEVTNKVWGYLCGVSRLLDRPLAVIVRASTAAGKSSLMDAILALMPPECRVKYSALTGQALYYLGGTTDLKHKILAIVEEEGAEKASYALKLLQSEGELSIASTGKDPVTGRMVTQEYRVEGPVMIFLTTTAVDLDEELLNRCIVLTVDESREQTAAIHAAQRKAETLAGLIEDERRAAVLGLHRNAQRLLRPLKVVNPYGERLTFLDDRTRTRRDHKKYLTLIRTIALLHQYQRPVQTMTEHGRPVEYIEVTLEDIAAANALAHDVLGRCLDDMPPQTRALLGLIQKMERERGAKAGPWRRRDLRAACGWSDTALKVHLSRLVELEYVFTQRDSEHLNGLVYEALFDGEVTAQRPHLSGLLDVETLRNAVYPENRSGQNGSWSGVGQPLVRGQSGVGQGGENAASCGAPGASESQSEKPPENAHQDGRESAA